MAKRLPPLKRPPTIKPIEKLSDLTPDPVNANSGTERGVGMLEHSLRQYGAGRSILVDREGRVIAGNKTLERAEELGLGIIVVQTRGDKLVVVQREDLDLLDEANADARHLALADNRVAEVDLTWDATALKALQRQDTDLSAWFFEDELQDILEPKAGRKQKVEFDADTKVCTCCKHKCKEGCGCYRGV